MNVEQPRRALDVPADDVIDNALTRLVRDRTHITRTLTVDVDVLRRGGDVLTVYGGGGQVRITSTLTGAVLTALLRDLADTVEDSTVDEQAPA